MFLTLNTTPPKLYIWYPYSSILIEKNSCSTIEELNKKLNVTQIPKTLIPNPLNVRIVVNPPSIISINSGSDIQIVKEIAKIFQTELLLSENDKPLDFGYVQPNGTITGAFGAVYYQEVDLAAGALLLNADRFKLVDVSYHYHNERWYWCVPRASKIPSWKQVFVTMKLQTWFMIFGTYIIISVLLWCFSLITKVEIVYKNLWNCFFIKFCILLGTSVNLWPRNRSTKLLTLFWVIVCFILHTMYSTKFISLMHLGVEEKQIKTKEEILGSNLEIWLKSSTVNFFGDSPSLIPFFKKEHQCCHALMDCVNQIVYSKNSAAFVAESFTSYVKNQFIGANKLPLFYCFDSGVDVSLLILLMRKGFVLTEYIDKILRQFLETGFIQLWRKRTFMSQKVQIEENPDSKITFEFFKAPLFCWIFGIILALGVFVLEKVTIKCEPFVKNVLWKRKNKALEKCKC
ncbi:hypothetical protein Zmor_007561 [Zophobas morio]|uniref:Ionotropic glutamate receptor C-terminal domain-containing protein n=1 Tax=Zophobas morio TaxID=2755281 RepID=A0AA38IWW8_9CUCU|nr:hypothetical protein Zmor_007561 [Zophobas morio]